ncbi:hypothetical protein BC827DRAFT_520578 [Russula dissimulans]|nr:hypothetical protein BC827DRAFT_520578 [Russula dissimulans]
MTTPTLLIDGYISQSFPNKDAEDYICHLLKMNSSALRRSCLAYGKQDRSGVLFLVNAIPMALSSIVRPYTQGPDGHPLWILDHSIVRTGTVVPQVLWSPQNVNAFEQYVSDATLQMPIFFTHLDGTLGLSLSDAANGCCQTLCNGREQAQLGGKVTTCIRILWPGYNDYKRQVQIKDETAVKNPITVGKFAHHIGRTVEAFLRDVTPNTARRADRWIIGQGGIIPANIRVIGAIHVSAGTWMPILQLNNVWVF